MARNNAELNDGLKSATSGSVIGITIQPQGFTPGKTHDKNQ